MAFNSQRLSEIAIERSQESIGNENYLRENREWLTVSQDIAMTILYYIREEGLTQKSIADKIGVKPCYITKLLKGQENLQLSTILKLQEALGHPLINVPKPYLQNAIKPISTPTRWVSVKPQSVFSDTHDVFQPEIA